MKTTEEIQTAADLLAYLVQLQQSGINLAAVDAEFEVDLVETLTADNGMPERFELHFDFGVCELSGLPITWQEPNND